MGHRFPLSARGTHSRRFENRHEGTRRRRGYRLLAAQASTLTGDAALVTGIDPSPGMMAASTLPETMMLIEGRAESLPFPDDHFDYLSIGYALRHIGDLSVAFAEFERVLKPGGRLCLLEITKPQSRVGQWLLKNYMRGVFSEYQPIKAGPDEFN